KGYFSDAFNIYLPIYAIAITGLNIAVSRMVSQRCALGAFREAREIQKVAKRLFLIAGLGGTALLMAIAYPFVTATFNGVPLSTGGRDSIPSIIAIAPTVYFCCAMSAYRGYYEGLRNMKPTAVSQVLEALCKLVLGLGFAILVMELGLREFAASGTVFGKIAADEDIAKSMLYPWASAASIMGITIGAVLSLAYLWLHQRIRGDGITQEQLLLAPPPENRKKLSREMITVAIPMVISSAILNVTNIIDWANVSYLLNRTMARFPDVIGRIYGAALAGKPPDKHAVWIWGVYNTSLDFRTLIPTIITALGVSALPAIAAAWTLRDNATVHKHINTVLRVALMISLPAGFGMAVLSKEIMTLFYEAKNHGMAEHAAPMMMIFGLATGLMAISAPVISMLQGIGRTDVPVKSLIAGTIVKIGANQLLVSNPEINVKGAAIGTVLFYVVIVSINLFMLIRVSKTKVHWMSVLFKPLFCAVLCAAAAWLAKDLVQRFLPRINSNEGIILFFSVVASIGCAVLVYVVSMLLCRAVTEEDLENLPMGKKLGKVLAKLRLLG
ncbi:MAG: polysaccharide biosynthesis protein, partial [Firmicutes bacterium]|nr:polysaccharide biosynthesis protein [Bacillota bacterium]